jgi:hypothetical protein
MMGKSYDLDGIFAPDVLEIGAAHIVNGSVSDFGPLNVTKFG